MPTNEHGDDYDEDWVPESPVLRGEVRTPDKPIERDSRITKPDELPHRYRRDLGIDSDEPDPGYDPDDDDLVPA